MKFFKDRKQAKYLLAREKEKKADRDRLFTLQADLVELLPAIKEPENHYVSVLKAFYYTDTYQERLKSFILNVIAEEKLAKKKPK